MGCGEVGGGVGECDGLNVGKFVGDVEKCGGGVGQCMG